MTTDDLIKKYGGPMGRGEHPDFPVQAWGESAIEDCTRLGYWEWVLFELMHATED